MLNVTRFFKNEIGWRKARRGVPHPPSIKKVPQGVYIFFNINNIATLSSFPLRINNLVMLHTFFTRVTLAQNT